MATKRKGRGLSPTARATAAGEQYAVDQMQSTHFDDWVRDQLIEAEQIRKRDPDRVLPLKTKADALEVARNMLQQLEWDTQRDLGFLAPSPDIERIAGSGDAQTIKAFYQGFHKAIVDAEHWLADEVLYLHREIRGRARESQVRLGARVRDYIAVDSRGRKIAGPFKSYSDAKTAAGPGGHTKFVPSTREVPRGVARSARLGRQRRPRSRV